MENPFKKIAQAGALTAAMGAAGAQPTEAASLEPDSSRIEMTGRQTIEQQRVDFQMRYELVAEQRQRLENLADTIPDAINEARTDIHEKLMTALLGSLEETQAFITNLSESAAIVSAETMVMDEINRAQEGIRTLRDAQRHIDAVLRKQLGVIGDDYSSVGPNARAVLEAYRQNITQGTLQ